LWCVDGLFLGAEKHAMDFNFIFSISQNGKGSIPRGEGGLVKALSGPGSGG
jgi:hypothetical protein